MPHPFRQKSSLNADTNHVNDDILPRCFQGTFLYYDMDL